jgi:hypothetical protein
MSHLYRRDPARDPDVTTENSTISDSAPRPTSRPFDVATKHEEAFHSASAKTRLPEHGIQQPRPSPPSTLSVGYADLPFGFPPETPVFSGEVPGLPSTETGAWPRRLRLNLSPGRCRQRVVPADPTAAEALVASRQRRTVDNVVHAASKS